MKPLKRPLQRVNYPVLLFTKITGALPSWLFFRPRIYRVPDAPRGKLPGGTLLVSNHTSLLDFVLYLLIFPWNTLRFLIAEVLFSKSTVLSRLLYALGGIFVDRTSHDFSFVADAVRVLQSGGIVGVFPQGRLPIGDTPFPFLPSAVYIALHSNATIVPVYTAGEYGRRRARVVIGAPFSLRSLRSGSDEPDQAELAVLNAMLQARVMELAQTLPQEKKQ